MSKIILLVYVFTLFLSGCLFFQGKTSNTNSKKSSLNSLSFDNKFFKTKHKPRKLISDTLPNNRHKKEKIKNFILLVPSDIYEERDKFSLKKYSEDNPPKIEVAPGSQITFKIIEIDKSKKLHDSTKEVTLSTPSDLVTIDGMTVTFKSLGKNYASDITLKATASDESDDSSGSVNIRLTVMPVCGNGYGRLSGSDTITNSIMNPNNGTAISGTNESEISANSSCLKLLLFDGLYYSGTPSFTIVNNAGVTMNDETGGITIPHYKQPSSKDKRLDAKFPAFKAQADDGVDGQYQAWCVLLNDVKFAGLETWRRATAYEMGHLFDKRAIQYFKWPVVWGYLTSTYIDGEEESWVQVAYPDGDVVPKDTGIGEFVSCVAAK